VKAPEAKCLDELHSLTFARRVGRLITTIELNVHRLATFSSIHRGIIQQSESLQTTNSIAMKHLPTLTQKFPRQTRERYQRDSFERLPCEDEFVDDEGELIETPLSLLSQLSTIFSVADRTAGLITASRFELLLTYNHISQSGLVSNRIYKSLLHKDLRFMLFSWGLRQIKDGPESGK
jgi:hypothetical protein